MSVNHPDLDGVFTLLSHRSQFILMDVLRRGPLTLDKIQIESCVIGFDLSDDCGNNISLSLVRKNFNRPCPVCGSERVAHERPVLPMVSL